MLILYLFLIAIPVSALRCKTKWPLWCERGVFVFYSLIPKYSTRRHVTSYVIQIETAAPVTAWERITKLLRLIDFYLRRTSDRFVTSSFFVCSEIYRQKKKTAAVHSIVSLMTSYLSVCSEIPTKNVASLMTSSNLCRLRDVTSHFGTRVWTIDRTNKQVVSQRSNDWWLTSDCSVKYRLCR